MAWGCEPCDYCGLGCLTKSRKGAEELHWAAHADRSSTATFSARSAIGLSIVFGAFGQHLKTLAIDGVYLPWYKRTSHLSLRMNTCVLALSKRPSSSRSLQIEYGNSFPKAARALWDNAQTGTLVLRSGYALSCRHHCVCNSSTESERGYFERLAHQLAAFQTPIVPYTKHLIKKKGFATLQ